MSLQITIHPAYFTPFKMSNELHKYIEFNLHTNPYCLYLKGSPELWQQCVRSHEQICIKCVECGSFFGMCHTGVCEYVYSLKFGNDVYGFICVSGYRPDCNDELYQKALHKIRKSCAEFSFDYENTVAMYEKNLTDKIPQKKEIDVLIEPLCDLITLELSELGSFPESNLTTLSKKDDAFYRICTEIRLSHNTKLELSDLAERTNYSPSYISHLFKSKSGMTINQYINSIRISEAKALLMSTKISIQDISMMTGFSDPTYFTNVFRKSEGMSPREWRKSNSI